MERGRVAVCGTMARVGRLPAGLTLAVPVSAVWRPAVRAAAVLPAAVPRPAVLSADLASAVPASGVLGPGVLGQVVLGRAHLARVCFAQALLARVLLASAGLTRTALLLAVLALAVPAGAGAAAAAEAIGALLPAPKSKAACFIAAPAEPVAMTLEDWSEGAVTHEEVPGLKDPAGKPAIRPVPRRSGGQATSLVLSIAPDELNPSEPYRFLLAVSFSGRRPTLRASGPCTVFDPVRPGEPAAAGSAQARLGCGVECDGGSFGVERPGIGRALALSFAEGGLRMTAGCSDEADAVQIKAVKPDTVFTLVPAEARACRALRAWDAAR